MSAKNKPDSKIIQSKGVYERAANTRKPNVTLLYRDVEALGIVYVRSKEIVNELLEINPDLGYRYDSDDGMYTVTHAYTGKSRKSL